MTDMVLEKIIEMFIIMIGGIAAYKAGLIDQAMSKKLSNLLLMFISPMLIFVSYQMDFNTKLLHGLLWTLIASAATFLAVILLTALLFRRTGERIPVEKIAVVYSNCGFIGIPLINGILGSEGVFYMTVYTAVFNLLFWTHGVRVMGGSSSLAGIWKNLINPSIIAVIAGMVFFIGRLHMPEIAGTPMRMIASMNTPLAMLVAGANLAQSSLAECLKNLRLYSVAFVKLLLVPAVGIFVLFFLHFDFNVSFTILIAMACPAGTTTIMFAERYNKDALYASQLLIITTVFSTVTMPLMSGLAEQFLR